MPKMLQYDLTRLGDCSECGASQGEWCTSNTGKLYKDFAHRARAPEYGRNPRVFDRRRNGQTLPSYPLAQRYEWEVRDDGARYSIP